MPLFNNVVQVPEVAGSKLSVKLKEDFSSKEQGQFDNFGSSSLDHISQVPPATMYSRDIQEKSHQDHRIRDQSTRVTSSGEQMVVEKELRTHQSSNNGDRPDFDRQDVGDRHKFTVSRCAMLQFVLV